MLDLRFASTEFLVEATGFEVLMLWKENRERDSSLTWIQDNPGCMIQVGEVALVLTGMPVCISVSWVILNGHRIAFWEAISQVVDHQLIQKWFDKNCNPHYDRYKRQARTNAMNFHLALDVCRS